VFQCLRSKTALVLTMAFQVIGKRSVRLGRWAMDMRDAWASRV
jgi:hypothetical protein